MRQTNEQSLKEVIHDLLKEYRIENHVNAAMIKKSWEKLMGRSISRHTNDIQLRDKCLILKIDSPALRNELNFAKEKIKENINEEFKMKLIEQVIIS